MSDDTAKETEEEKIAAPEGSENSGLVLVSDVMPETLPILPIRPRPLFPDFPSRWKSDPSRLSIQHALEYSSKTVGIVLVRDLNATESRKIYTASASRPRFSEYFKAKGKPRTF